MASLNVLPKIVFILRGLDVDVDVHVAPRASMGRQLATFAFILRWCRCQCTCRPSRSGAGNWVQTLHSCWETMKTPPEQPTDVLNQKYTVSGPPITVDITSMSRLRSKQHKPMNTCTPSRTAPICSAHRLWQANKQRLDVVDEIFCSF